MLWYKNWLELRWRAAFSVLMYALLLYSVYKGAPSRPEGVLALTGSFAYMWIITALMAAGTGIKTQSANLSAARGLHGSTYFTLSLPISRTDLFGIRTIMGVLQMAVIIVVANCGLWALFPALHAGTTLGTAVEYGLAVFICSLVFYFFSALLAVFMDPIWWLYGGLLAIGACWWLTRGIQSSLNVFKALEQRAPLITHTIPWPAMGMSLAISLVLFLVTLRIVQTREF
jgi:hypothetical protein